MQNQASTDILAHWQYTPEEWQRFANYVRQQSQATAGLITISLSVFFLVIYTGILLGANSLPFKLVVALLIFVLFHLPVLGLWFRAGRNKNLQTRLDRPNEVVIGSDNIQWNDKREDFYYLVDAEIKPAANATLNLLLVRVNRRQSYRRYEIPIPEAEQQSARELAEWINQPPQA